MHVTVTTSSPNHLSSLVDAIGHVITTPSQLDVLIVGFSCCHPSWILFLTRRFSYRHIGHPRSDRTLIKFASRTSPKPNNRINLSSSCPNRPRLLHRCSIHTKTNACEQRSTSSGSLSSKRFRPSMSDHDTNDNRGDPLSLPWVESFYPSQSPRPPHVPNTLHPRH